MKSMIFSVLLIVSSAVYAVSGNIQTDDSLSATTAEKGRVSRSNFTSHVENHEPVDSLLSLSNQQSVVYYFSELLFLKGQTVIHRWEYGGKVIADVKFTAGGDRWRVWSKKTLSPSSLGEWRVSILDQTGRVLATSNLLYTQASQ